MLAAGNLHRPVRERIVSELQFNPLGLAILCSAGAEAAVIVERELNQVVDLLLVSRIIDRIDGIGVPVGDGDDVIEVIDLSYEPVIIELDPVIIDLTSDEDLMTVVSEDF